MTIQFLDYIRKVPINYWIIIIIILIGCICIWWFFREDFQTIPPTTTLALGTSTPPKFNYTYVKTQSKAFREKPNTQLFTGYINKTFDNYEVYDTINITKKYLLCTTNAGTTYYPNILARQNIKYIFADGFDMVKVCNKVVYILIDNVGADYLIRGDDKKSVCPVLIKHFLSTSDTTNDVNPNYGVLSCTVVGDGYNCADANDFKCYNSISPKTKVFFSGGNYNASITPVIQRDTYSSNMLAFKINYLNQLLDRASVTQIVSDLSSGGYDWSIWNFNGTGAIIGNIGDGYSYYSNMVAHPQLKVYEFNDAFKKFMGLEFYNDLPALTYDKSKECYTISYGELYLVINESLESPTVTISLTKESNDATIFTIYTATSPDNNPNNNVYKYVALNETNEFIKGPYIIGFDYINSNDKSNVLKCYKYNLATGTPVLFTTTQVKTMNDALKLHNLYMPWFEFHNISAGTSPITNKPLSTTETYLRGSNTLAGVNFISSIYPAYFKAITTVTMVTGFYLDNTNTDKNAISFKIERAIYNPGTITTSVITDIYVSTDNKYYFINKYNNSAYVKLFAYPELKEVDINSYEKLTIDNPNVDNLYEITGTGGVINIIAKIYNYKTCKELIKLSTPITLSLYVPDENFKSFNMIEADNPVVAKIGDDFSTVYMALNTESGYTTDITQALQFTLYRSPNATVFYAELTNTPGTFMCIDYEGNIQFVAEQSIYSKNTSKFYPDKYFYYNYNIWLNALGNSLVVYDISKKHMVIGNKYNGKSIAKITFEKYEEPTTTAMATTTTARTTTATTIGESIPAETKAKQTEPTTLLTADPEISLSAPITTQYEPILPTTGKTTTMPTTTTTSQTLYTTVATTKYVPVVSSHNSSIQLITL